MKIGILVPSTTRGTKAKKLEDTHLFKYLINSLIRTLDCHEENQYHLYLAIDDNDNIYSKFQTKKKLLNKDTYSRNNKFIKIIPHICSTKNIEKGNVVGYWNMLFKKAYDDGCDYFVQSGDDIVYHNRHWLNICIHHLNLCNGYGVSTPIDINNPKLMTQSVVSRKHMDIFGFYYPPELKSWFCDNWITDIYKKQFGAFIRATLENKGGAPRYTPPDWETTKSLCNDLLKKYQPKLLNHLNLSCQN